MVKIQGLTAGQCISEIVCLRQDKINLERKNLDLVHIFKELQRFKTKTMNFRKYDSLGDKLISTQENIDLLNDAIFMQNGQIQVFEELLQEIRTIESKINGIENGFYIKALSKVFILPAQNRKSVSKNVRCIVKAGLSEIWEQAKDATDEYLKTEIKPFTSCNIANNVVTLELKNGNKVGMRYDKSIFLQVENL